MLTLWRGVRHIVGGLGFVSIVVLLTAAACTSYSHVPVTLSQQVLPQYEPAEARRVFIAGVQQSHSGKGSRVRKYTEFYGAKQSGSNFAMLWTKPGHPNKRFLIAFTLPPTAPLKVDSYINSDTGQEAGTNVTIRFADWYLGASRTGQLHRSSANSFDWSQEHFDIPECTRMELMPNSGAICGHANGPVDITYQFWTEAEAIRFVAAFCTAFEGMTGNACP